MTDFKKIDDRDFVFINKPLSEEEEQKFRDFLRSRKKKNVARASRLPKKAHTLND